ncbi:SDR family NAD(P)-dependent oxidoreductase [Leucobacter sp. Z1108]|uniref:SDR family NAD(P)-dependent oxidoreductase n=1 Tax=Leucobacter sp. Z1108 TaxID=3439066 RepID=UPI003F3059F5
MSSSTKGPNTLALDERIAIVTGGGNGIGERSAHTLASRGAQVIVLDPDVANAQRVVDDITKQGGRAELIGTDATNEDEVQAALEVIVQRHGRIDILNNNAAVLALTTGDLSVIDTPHDHFIEALRANLGGPYLMCHHVIPIMLRNGGGSIVNIASVSGMFGEPNLTAYGIAKAGVIQLTRAIAAQFGPQGIRCNAVAPSYVTTPNNEIYAPPELSEAYLRCTPTGRLSAPQDIAEVVAFLASESARQINGHTLPVDGGLVAATSVTEELRESLRK